MRFINLHGHTSFSNQDGHGTPQQHVDRVKELGMSALALTEHGNTSSHVQLEQAAIKAGIKPIYGCELYVALPKTRAKFHQTVLAMNQDGYRQLNRLVSAGWRETFAGSMSVNPRDLLKPRDVNGLIVLSGCADSWLSCLLAGGKSLGPKLDLAAGVDKIELQQRFEKALYLVDVFQRCYGDRYYLELQPFSYYDRTCYLNERLQELSEKTGVPLVATCDVHYHEPGGWRVQQLANALGWGKTFEEVGANRDYAASECTFPESDEYLTKRLVSAHVTTENAETAIDNTRIIADRCNVILPKTNPIRVSFNIDGTDHAAVELLKQSLLKGLQFRFHNFPEFAAHYKAHASEYKARINKEFGVIQAKGFADYFLINQQIISWAKNQGIVVGPGRGSAAGSLVCYLLQITEINPMLYPNMLFERFLDPGREDAPDIDTDYQDSRRKEIFDYARATYGEENVGNIGNFNRYRGKTAVKDTARALRIPLAKAEQFAGYIGDTPHGSPREFNSAEDAATVFHICSKMIQQYPDWKLAFSLEGDQKTMGVHAAGMVLSNSKISDTCAIYRRKKAGEEDYSEIIAFDKRDAAYLNMLKLDCLGLSTMTLVGDAIDMIEGVSLQDIYRLTPDDPKVLQKWVDDDLTGVFQFEGATTRKIVQQVCTGLEGTNFSVLSDINALSRPGAMTSGMTAQYIKVANGASPRLIHPIIDALLTDTNGCLVYQEQVMRIGKEFGGLSDHEIGRLRKIIGAKQQGGAFEEFWVKFRDGAKALHGVDEQLSRQVWDWMAASSNYLFNIAHAVSYTTIAYWCAWLKTYYPLEFYTAALRVASGKGSVKGKMSPEKVLLLDAVKHGVKVLPPDITRCEADWSAAEGGGIMGGLKQIKGLGAKTTASIMDYMTSHEVKGWSDLQKAVRGLGPKTVQRCQAFCESSDPFDLALSSRVAVAVTKEVRWAVNPFTAEELQKFDGQKVRFAGQVLSVTHIDVVADLAERKGVTRTEVLEGLKRPDFVTRARVIALDPCGGEFRMTVNRFVYPQVEQQLRKFDDKGVWGVVASGVANAEFHCLMVSEITVKKIDTADAV